MEQKSKNRMRVILFLFLFGFLILASGLSLAQRGFNIEGISGLLMMAGGVLCVVLGIHLVKSHWY